MLAIVAVSLTISLLLVFSLVAFAFLNVAFSGPSQGPKSDATSWLWQPPLAHGKELLAWAARKASAVTARRLAAPRSRDVAGQLAAEIYQGVTYAIAQSPSTVGQSKPDCPNYRCSVIGLTPPEALAIAETIRSTKPSREINRIRDRAVMNAEKIVGLGLGPYARALIVCPLFSGDSSCAVFDDRPLHCRGCCLSSGENGGRSFRSLGDSRHVNEQSYSIGHGAEEGLSHGIISAGLDGNVYELNSALTAALDTPAAARQWAQGEPVFEQCKRYEQASLCSIQTNIAT